ncbi:MAG: SpoIID/LytB domain-containing protein [Candidatus Blackburnbacteria bacterium]|nr:SpoIID/LytB domain-containing protein [Candidatus Blackburnbacteria bacterium]
MLLTIIFRFPVVASNCPEKDYDCQIQEIQRDIDQIKPAHEKNKSDLAGLRKQIQNIRAKIFDISTQLNNLEKDILDREEKLALREELFNQKSKRHYIVLRQYDPLAPFLLAESATDLLRQVAIRKRIIAEDQKEILKLAEQISSLEKDRETLKTSRASLTSSQQQLDKKAEFLAGEVAKVESYLAGLTSKQKNLLAQKLASLNLPTSLGAGPLLCTDDRKLDPGFSPAFALFTYGIPHRVGLNQYGAYGRAKLGQNYQDILRAYYDGISIEKRSNVNLKVKGYGEMPLEQYLLGIYEMPGDWPAEALKAQVVAARSYALAYTDNGAKEICTTQACQVYKGGSKGGNWEAAVRATEGETLVSGGQPITAWYASTFGGYALRSDDVGWSPRPWTKRLRDTLGDVGNFGELNERAYDKDSPCFYAAQGFRKEYAKSAWLKSEEVADIVNVWLLGSRDPSTQNHLSQVDRSNPDGVETWDTVRVRQELQSRGLTPYTSVSSVSVSGWDTSVGKTNSVSIEGNAGTQTISADEFRNFFNLRAPGNIQIVGPLFNAERR